MSRNWRTEDTGYAVAIAAALAAVVWLAAANFGLVPMPHPTDRSRPVSEVQVLSDPAAPPARPEPATPVLPSFAGNPPADTDPAPATAAAAEPNTNLRPPGANPGPAGGGAAEPPGGGFINLVSQPSGGVSGNNLSGGTLGDPRVPSVSLTRDVAFSSNASNLVAADSLGDDNGTTDVFVRNISSPLADPVLISMSRSTDCGKPMCTAGGPSRDPAISADGLVVAFTSTASDLTEDPPLFGRSSIFIRTIDPLGAGTTQRVDTSALEVDADAVDPSISSDGNHVAFTADGDQGRSQVYVYDRLDGSFELVSTTSLVEGGVIGNDDSFSPQISGDGRTVACASHARDLVGPGGDTNNRSDIFIRDLDDDVTTKVTAYNADSTAPDISEDGTVVVFQTAATDVGDGQDNGLQAVYRYDRTAGTTTLVSRGDPDAATEGSGDADGPSTAPAVSGDGKTVAFQSAATNLVAGDTNASVDVFSWRDDGIDGRNDITRQSVDENLGQIPVHSFGPAFASSVGSSGDGVLVFVSEGQLAIDDTNTFSDIFVIGLCEGSLSQPHGGLNDPAEVAASTCPAQAMVESYVAGPVPKAPS